MHPRFGIERERNNSLFFKKYSNDRCLFHFHSQIELYFVDEGEMDCPNCGEHLEFDMDEEEEDEE